MGLLIQNSKAEIPYFNQWMVQNYPTLATWQMSESEIAPYYEAWLNTEMGAWYFNTTVPEREGNPLPPEGIINEISGNNAAAVSSGGLDMTLLILIMVMNNGRLNI